jgi:flagellar hook-associated protein 3 FlgL
MSNVGFSNLAQSLSLRWHNQSLKSDLQIASSEAVTGQAHDLAKALHGDFAQLSSIDRALARFKSFHLVQQDLKSQTTAVQSALELMDSLASSLRSSIHSTTLSASDTQVSSLAQVAHENLKASLSALNVKAGDRAVFAGAIPDQTPLPDAETIIAALQQSLSGVTTPQEAHDRTLAWFSSANGLASLYRGGSEQESIFVSDSDRLHVGVTALDPAITQTLAGFAMGALVDAGLFAGQPENRAAVVDFAAQSLTQTTDGRIVLAARIGRTEERLQTVSTRMAAESSALQIARTDLIGVDPYEAATRLTSAETQLQSLYTITARLSRLTLSDYI